MPRKTKVTQTQVVEVVDTIDKKPKRFVPPGALTNIQLTENQKKLLQIIEDNKICIILGPAGCLTKNSKILIYSMKSKNKKHTIIYENHNKE